MDAEAKERLIDEFRACLEEWDDDENKSGDDTGEPPVDLSMLFAELSILRNEVRIEARQFKTALDEMRALGQLLGEQNERLTRDLERAREAAASAQRQVERRLLLDMLDVRDRVDAAVSVFRAWRPSFLSRLATTETKIVRGMGEGIELTLQRLDDLLVERRVRPIEALGTRLDPNIMRAIGVESDPQRGVGEVLHEVRRGYLREDDLLRPAEVIVNKP